MIDEVKKIKAIACSIRLRLINILLNKDEGLFVCDLVKILELQQYNISKHLIILKNAGLVTDSKVGRSVIYRFDYDNRIFQDFIVSMHLERYPLYKRDIDRLNKFITD